MNDIIKTKIQEIPTKHKNEHDGYEFYKRELVPKGNAQHCAISVYEIPPGKSAYPYHYHTENEEAFYILKGNGILKTPTGETKVSAGDFLFFPANEQGAHKLTNCSETESLEYLDFDTYNELDVAFYPDSGKVGIWGRNINKLFKLSQQVDYYDGE